MDLIELEYSKYLKSYYEVKINHDFIYKLAQKYAFVFYTHDIRNNKPEAFRLTPNKFKEFEKEVQEYNNRILHNQQFKEKFNDYIS